MKKSKTIPCSTSEEYYNLFSEMAKAKGYKDMSAMAREMIHPYIDEYKKKKAQAIVMAANEVDIHHEGAM